MSFEPNLASTDAIARSLPGASAGGARRCARVLTLVCVTLISGCDESTDLEVVARIGWRFDYRDWTKPLCACAELSEAACGTTQGCSWSGSTCKDNVVCTPPDVRGCANQPAGASDAPAYPAIETVQLRVVDPQNGDTRRDIELDCSDGDGSPLLAVRALPRREQQFSLVARDASGADLYSQAAPFVVDLSTVAEEVFELRTLTGELEMDLTYPGQDVGTCPGDAASASYELTWASETTPIMTGTVTPVCDPPDFLGISLSRKLYLRSIPASPSGGLLPQLQVQVEVRDASNTPTYCGETTRNITPGRNAFNDDLTLSARPCSP